MKVVNSVSGRIPALVSMGKAVMTNTEAPLKREHLQHLHRSNVIIQHKIKF